MANGSYQVGVNQFSDMTEKEFLEMFGKGISEPTPSVERTQTLYESRIL